MPGAQSRPPWADSKASRAWLEQQYPLGDASLGSPLYRYIRDVYYKLGSNNPGTSLLRLSEMLTWEEQWRWMSEPHDLPFSYTHNVEKLYPKFGEPTNLPRPTTLESLRARRRMEWESVNIEPKWTDVEASRTWLERCYPFGSSALGSPLLGYMRACHALQDSTSSSPAHLGSMLTNSEWKRFLGQCPNSNRHRQHVGPDNILYPEFDEESPDATDIDSNDLIRQDSASSSKRPLTQPSRKRAIQELEPEQPVSFPSNKRRAISDTSGDDSLVSNTPKETPLADRPGREALKMWKLHRRQPPRLSGSECRQGSEELGIKATA